MSVANFSSEAAERAEGLRAFASQNVVQDSQSINCHRALQVGIFHDAVFLVAQEAQTYGVCLMVLYAAAVFWQPLLEDESSAVFQRTGGRCKSLCSRGLQTCLPLQSKSKTRSKVPRIGETVLNRSP